MNQTIIVNGKPFRPMIGRDEIAKRVAALADAINKDYEGKSPLVLGVLNGAFMFAADLFRQLTIDTTISFVKLASYHGTSSTGSVTTAIGLTENVAGRDVIIVEDIIDTGKTLSSFLPELHKSGTASVRIATFLTKPDQLKYDVRGDYVGFEIENRFVLGYGLDYDGHGRNLPDLYMLAED